MYISIYACVHALHAFTDVGMYVFWLLMSAFRNFSKLPCTVFFQITINMTVQVQIGLHKNNQTITSQLVFNTLKQMTHKFKSSRTTKYNHSPRGLTSVAAKIYVEEIICKMCIFDGTVEIQSIQQ